MARRGRPKKSITPEQVDIELQKEEHFARSVEGVTEEPQSTPEPLKKASNVIVQYPDGYKCFMARNKAQHLAEQQLVVIVDEV